MSNSIYIKRSTKTGVVRWAVVSRNKYKMIDKGEIKLSSRKELINLVAHLKSKYNTTTAYQLLTLS